MAHHHIKLPTSLDQDDPLEAALDSKAYLLKQAREQFTNRCYMGYFIKEVLEINTKSALNLHSSNQSGCSTTDIEFTADVIHYSRGDVITDCKITFKDKNSRVVTVESKYASITYHERDFNNAFAVGQIIPMRIHKIDAPLYAPRMDLHAEPFRPAPEPVWLLLSSDFKGDMSHIEAELKVEYDMRDKIIKENKKIYNQFKDMLYPFNDINNRNVKNGKPIAKITQLAKKGVWLGFPAEADKSDPFIYTRNEKPETKFIEMEGHIAVVTLMRFHCNQLRLIREHLVTYNETDVFKAHANLWMYYKTLKQ